MTPFLVLLIGFACVLVALGAWAIVSGGTKDGPPEHVGQADWLKVTVRAAGLRSDRRSL